MKNHLILTLFWVLVSYTGSLAQAQSGLAILPEADQPLELGLLQYESIDHPMYRYIRFDDFPTEIERKRLADKGIELLAFARKGRYLASIKNEVTVDQLRSLGVVQISRLSVDDKCSISITELIETGIDEDDLTVYFKGFPAYPLEDQQSIGEDKGWEVKDLLPKTMLGHAVVPFDLLKDFIMHPAIRYVDVLPPVGTPESDDGRNVHRSNLIDVDYFGGPNYDGSGVRMVVNDDGYVGPHIDFNGRIEQSDVEGDFVGTHGDGVAGVMSSAGNLNPNYRGMATGSFLHIRQYHAELPETENLHIDSGMVVFNSSYSNGCNAGYTMTTQLVDQEMFNNPALMQVFSAGNSNNNDCGYGAGDQWGNITGGHKAGKNCIATANLFSNDVIVESSSRGPAHDGRIKPDIAAHGQGQVSNDPDYEYGEFGGTSAAAPGIAGVLGQLYQAYRELYSEEAPAALLKAILMNTANDLGNVGPDFIFGWGKVNARKALSVLEEGRFLTGFIGNGDVQQIPIDVPPGVELAKIMVYWPDVEAEPEVDTALVNDLDIIVHDPQSGTHLPYVLDHTPSPVLLNLPATAGEDHLNNVEQVAILYPTPGEHLLDISGFSVPFGPQEFYVIYEFLTAEVQLTYPNGGEGFEPNTWQRIHWDAYGLSGEFQLDMSLDGGASWEEIGTYNEGARFITYLVPDTLVSGAKYRVMRNGFSDESDTTFSIIGIPSDLTVDDACFSTEGFTVDVSWQAVEGANAYDVFVLGEQYMDSVDQVSSTMASVFIPNDQEGWFSVRARSENGAVGQRAIAVRIGVGGEEGPCLLHCDVNADAGVQAIISPVETSFNCDLPEIPVHVVLENISDSVQSGFTIYYEFNGQQVSQVFNGQLQPGEFTPFTFDQTLAPPGSVGSYDFRVWTDLGTDLTFCNDSMNAIVDVQDLGSIAPYAEDFESGNFPDQDATVIDLDEQYEWESIRVLGPGGDSTMAMFINNRNFEESNDNADIFRLAPIELLGTDFSYLTFDVAHRPYPTGSRPDTLIVNVSSNCGQTYEQFYFKRRLDLATEDPTGSPYFPEEAAEWRKDTVDLSALGNSTVVIQFENHSGSGNNLFIDNINIHQTNTGVDEYSSNFSVYPNPASSFLKLSGIPYLSEALNFSIADVTGRTLSSGTLDSQDREGTIDVSRLPNGVYVLHLNDTGWSSSRIVEILR